MAGLRPTCDSLDASEQDLEFQVVDWYIPESDRHLRRDYSAEPMEYEINMFGVTAEGYSVCASVKGFQPYFFIKCPKSWYNDKSAHDLKRRIASLKTKLLNETYDTYINDRMTGKRTKVSKNIIPYRLRSHLMYLKLVHRKDFWGFTNGTNFPFMKLKVKSLGLYNILRRYFQDSIDADKLQNKSTYELYESNIDPFLRFIHEQDIQPCGWVRCPAGCYKVVEMGAPGEADEDSAGPIARTNINIEVQSQYVAPLRYNKIAPLYIASFDIECTSAHGDFPLAKKSYFKLAQDIVRAFRFTNPSYETFLEWLNGAFKGNADPHRDARIHQVFPKAPPTDLQAKIVKAANAAYGILASSDLAEAANEHSSSDCESDDEPDTRAQVQKSSVFEKSVCDVFSKNLPPLKGDSIIQIGTTVHVYGSDDIVYKNIVTLNSCDEIEGAEVESYNTEEKLLMGWKEVISAIDPDVMIGYNTFGFDMEYIWTRAVELGICAEFAENFGRLHGRLAVLEEKKLSSSALGNNVMNIIQMHGIVNIDMMKVMQRDHKLDMYKLDYVASVFLGDNKHDVSPNEIFAKFKGTSADRCEVARYCLQDCALVNRLFHKLKVLENNVGMGNVCSVPLNYLFMRGQGIKIFSLVAKECRTKQYVIPAKKYIQDNDVIEDGYEGAIVLEPKEGMYLDEAITVFDYASLYPSSMIERNLSHDCYVSDPAYADLEDEGIKYVTVSYDIYEGVGDKKKSVGQKSCMFAQLPDNKKGIIPTILMKLLDARKTTRKKIEYETVTTRSGPSYAGLAKRCDNGDIKLFDVELGATKHIDAADVGDVQPTFSSFEQAVLDALQVAYKVTANSLYGQIGARTSPIYLKEIAACTTATGRERIQCAKKFMEDTYDAEVIYGDSVTSYTPVYVRQNGLVEICTIEDLGNTFGNSAWVPCYEEGKQNKEACELHGVETWTDKGWTPLHRVIRHELAPHKKIVRVLTHTGVVDVTDDHSLLDPSGNPVTSKEVTVGTSLLHHSYPECRSDNAIFSEAEAEVMGFFFGDGSCGYYECDSGNKASWALNNSDERLLNKYVNLCKKAYPNLSWVIMDTMESSGVNKISPKCNTYGSLTKFIKQYRTMMYNGKSKIIPREIFDSPLNVKEAFWRGLYDSDGDKDVHGYIRVDQKSMLSASHIARLAVCLGNKVSFNTRLDKLHIFRTTVTKRTQRKNSIQIKKMYEIPYEGYVYDLTTENHHFAAGVGQLIVHNTDSIFCKFPHFDGNGNRVYGQKTLEMGIKAGQVAAKAIKAFLPPPQSLEYEKTMYPFIIFSKKRYVGNLYEDDHTKKPKQKSMGIVLKRRDNAPIVKKVFGGLIDILLNRQDLPESVSFLNKMLQSLVNGETSLDDLIITKTLNSGYKDPTKIAHKVLADRIGDREPGNKPQINERIPFIYIQSPPGEHRLQGDRIESPSFIRANNLKPDYRFYITNQIKKSVCQLYALCVERIPDYPYAQDYWSIVEEHLMKQNIYQDEFKRRRRINALREKMVEELLFDPYLAQLPDHKPKKRTMAAYMEPPGSKNKSTKSTKSKTPKVQAPIDKTQAPTLEVSVKIATGYEGFYQITQGDVVLLREELKQPKKKTTKKVDVEKAWLQKALETIGENKELYENIKKNGIQLSLDIAIKRLITSTMKNKEKFINGSLYQQITDAAKTTDCDVCKNLSQEISCLFIVSFFEPNIRFEFV